MKLKKSIEAVKRKGKDWMFTDNEVTKSEEVHEFQLFDFQWAPNSEWIKLSITIKDGHFTNAQWVQRVQGQTNCRWIFAEELQITEAIVNYLNSLQQPK